MTASSSSLSTIRHEASERALQMPISAVFFCMPGRIGRALVQSWLDAGHHISAVVLAGKRRRKQPPEIWEKLVASGTLVLWVEYPIDWNIVQDILLPSQADILICYSFMRRIPDSLLQRYPHGGVNFHPSLLPHYKGPNPTKCMVADRALAKYGGLTLHRMTAAFDEGEILAQTTFEPRDYRSQTVYAVKLITTMTTMLREVIPSYCAGQVLIQQQPDGDFGWARYRPHSIVVDSDWPTNEIAAALAFLGQDAGIHAMDCRGRLIRIGQIWRRLGCPEGRPPVLHWHAIEFDCSDSRISVLRRNLPGKALERILRRPRRALFSRE